MVYDAIIIGGGMAGMSTAARLQAKGLSTLVLEAHGQPGGCAGLYRRKKFAFDVGATTLVDFEPGGVGGELLDAIGMSLNDKDILPGYKAWLPDREVILYRDRKLWEEERLAKLGNTPSHQKFWQLTDKLSQVFWLASRQGIKLPVQNLQDIYTAIRFIKPRNLSLARYLNWTMGKALTYYNLKDEKPLAALLAMLIEDTVHSTLEKAPLINACLGINLRGAGLSRAFGGMSGFWKRFTEHYKNLGGTLKVGRKVENFQITKEGYTVTTRKDSFQARNVVSAVPAEITAKIGPNIIQQKMYSYLQRDKNSLGGAIVVFLGVPEEEIAGQELTHHQLLQDYDTPLGNGNNMFISVSSPQDTESAPANHRSVMISTHCELSPWENLSEQEYKEKKQAIGEQLITYARRVYPKLATNPVVKEFATPQTYQKYTHRPRGAVGGVKQFLHNCNQHSLPHDIGVPGFWQVGDSTWPGLGTVACSMSSRIVANALLQKYSQRKKVTKTNYTPSTLRY